MVDIAKLGMDNNEISTYRWQCRRGMLELDILLNNFVDHKVTSLSHQQKRSFELLLSYPDQTLLDLLLGNSISSDPSISSIVQQIQSVSSN
jgi:antitoxin CptB